MDDRKEETAVHMEFKAVTPGAKIVRFKMRVIDCDRSEPTSARVRMNSVFDTEPSMNGAYIAGEPQGPLRFLIKNPEVARLFVEGQDYYVDFTPTFQEEGSNQGANSIA